MTDEQNLELVAAVYPSNYQARETMNELEGLHKDGTIEIVDAAVLVREYSGDLSISDRADVAPRKGAGRGAIIGGVIGVIFPPSLLAGAAIGAAAGAVVGKATEKGFDDDMLTELAADLGPGKSALIAVVSHEWHGSLVATIRGSDRILNRTVGAEEYLDVQMEAGVPVQEYFKDAEEPADDES